MSVLYDIQTPYVASNMANTNFINIEHYEKCKKVTEDVKPFLLCPQVGPKISSSDKTCVLQLLKNETPEDGLCTYRISKMTEIFTKMPTGNQWYFSFNAKKTLKIITRKNELFEIELTGTGIISITTEGQL